MVNNLYRKIKQLVARQWELKRIAGIIKHDKDKRAEFEKYATEYNQIDRTLDFIKQNCVISPIDVIDIISKKECENYVLKTFREIDEVDDRSFYTGRFISCYLNNKNKFFDYDKNGVSYDADNKYINYAISKDDFKELISSLEKTNSYVVANSEELSFIPAIAPSLYLARINFTKIFIDGYNDFASYNFQHRIKFELKQYLEEINADEVLAQKDNTEAKTL